MIIRAYKPTDREQVRTICHLTATAKEYVDNKDLVSALFAEYYTDYEPENIFILARESDDLAVGYILCAENYKRFIKTFTKEQLPKVRKISVKHAITQRFEFCQQRYDGRKYPAHMHIDLLPEAQRQGYGTKLVDALVAHLKANGVKGLMLGVGGDNEKGISFYKKYGFRLEHDLGKSAKIFGLDLTK